MIEVCPRVSNVVSYKKSVTEKTHPLSYDVNPTNDYHLRWTIPQQSVKVDNGTQMPTMMLVNLLESCKKSNCSDHYIKLITSWPKVNPWITTSMSKKRRTCPTLTQILVCRKKLHTPKWEMQIQNAHGTLWQWNSKSLCYNN